MESTPQNCISTTKWYFTERKDRKRNRHIFSAPKKKNQSKHYSLSSGCNIQPEQNLSFINFPPFFYKIYRKNFFSNRKRFWYTNRFIIRLCACICWHFFARIMSNIVDK